MDEFAKMIYNQWMKTDEADFFNWGDYDTEVNKIYDFLNEKIAANLETAINKKV